MKSPLDALFIGYEDQENLGLRYIMAYLQREGFTSRLLPYSKTAFSEIVDSCAHLHPRFIGFSIIFQYALDDFARLARLLRSSGIQAHFTAGGHFPTLRPKETLATIPELDSIVMGEGEVTTAELLSKLDSLSSSSTIPGLAYRARGGIIMNSPRPLIADLDGLPFPVRDKPHLLPRGIASASLLASRGCLFNCSYCSIRQFYGRSPGRLRRARSPRAVVDEMRQLRETDNVRFFIFQDDDFAARSPQQRTWIKDFLRELERARLSGEIRWKMSCRADDLNTDLLNACVDRGLIAVFLGIESGNPTGLRTFNKLTTVERNIEAIECLKRLGMTFNMGFMLFDPDSTISTIRHNLQFLRSTVSDGSCPVNFCKMLPYAGTPIERRLKEEHRMTGSLSQPNYDYHDPRLAWYELFCAKVFHVRNFDSLGLVERLGVAKTDHMMAREFYGGEGLEDYGEQIRSLIARSNSAALDTLGAALDFMERQDEAGIVEDWGLLEYFADRQWNEDTRLQKELDRALMVNNPSIQRSYEAEFERRMAIRSQESPAEGLGEFES